MLLAVFVLLLFLYSLVSRRLERTIVTAPIAFTAVGMVTWLVLPEPQSVGADAGILLHLAEIGLVLLLFTDASRTDLRVLRGAYSLPTRLLTTGMLLTMLLGALAARLVFPGLSIWEAGILAAILAPTDAGLGQVIVTSPRVPVRIRQALNVEAGLNDGLSVPFLLFFIALAGAGAEGTGASLAQFIAEQLGLGVVVGVGIGLVGGAAWELAHRRKWMGESFQGIGVVALPLLCMIVSDAVGASMFIAAFVAGLAVQIVFTRAGTHSVEFAEKWGELVNLSVFFIFGLAIGRDWSLLTALAAVYAVLSLTAVRMLPVALALMGTGLSRASVAFMGWFGPRGLASIVLGLVYLEHEIHLPGEETIRLAVIATVGLSIVAHGVTALPGIALYDRKLAALGAEAPEREGLRK